MSHTAAPPDRGASGGSQTAGVAEDQAAQVGQQAKSSAQRVAGVAGDQAAGVAAEARGQAADLLDQGRTQLQEQASAGQQRAATALTSLAEELRGMADGGGGGGIATHLASEASSRVEAVASWVSDREPADLFGEVQDFARWRPGAFLAAAAGLGVVAGRLTRSMTAAVKDEHEAAARPPQRTPQRTAPTTAQAAPQGAGTAGRPAAGEPRDLRADAGQRRDAPPRSGPVTR